jgi:hypothetical protein
MPLSVLCDASRTRRAAASSYPSAGAFGRQTASKLKDRHAAVGVFENVLDKIGQLVGSGLSDAPHLFGQREV